MPRIARKEYKEGVFHIMVQGINREKIFYKNEHKQKYLKLISKKSKEHEIQLISYCIMENHAHMIIQIKETKELTSFMKRVNTSYAIYYNQREKRVGYLFRNRFKSYKIYSQDYLAKCIKYIHMNPVKAGIVKQEEQYEYSSYNQYIKKEGIVTNELIEKVFKDKSEYIKEFLKIEYREDLFKDMEEKERKEEKDIQKEIEKFLQEEKIELEELKKNKILIKKLYQRLKEHTTQTELAKRIGISRPKITRIVNKET